MQFCCRNRIMASASFSAVNPSDDAAGMPEAAHDRVAPLEAVELETLDASATAAIESQRDAIVQVNSSSDSEVLEDPGSPVAVRRKRDDPCACCICCRCCAGRVCCRTRRAQIVTSILSTIAGLAIVLFIVAAVLQYLGIICIVPDAGSFDTISGTPKPTPMRADLKGLRCVSSLLISLLCTVAFVGDTALTSDTESLMNLIVSEGAQAFFHLGELLCSL